MTLHYWNEAVSGVPAFTLDLFGNLRCGRGRACRELDRQLSYLRAAR